MNINFTKKNRNNKKYWSRHFGRFVDYIDNSKENKVRYLCKMLNGMYFDIPDCKTTKIKNGKQLLQMALIS